jgi:glycosyltransferase involved in cell wall biosynthesis
MNPLFSTRSVGSKPHVCLLAETYFPVVGGGEVQARLLAEQLTARDYPVTVITRRTDRSHPIRERFGQVNVRRIPPVGSGGQKRWGMVLRTVPELWRERERFDIVLALGYRAVGISAVIAQKAFGLPCVFKAESSGEMSGEFFRPGLTRLHLSPDSPVVRQILRLRNRAFQRADAFVALSSHIERELLDAGVDAARIHRIPNGVDTDLFRPAAPENRAAARRALGLQAAQPVVVYTGRLVSYKGLPRLLRVWREIVGHVPDARLLLVGEEGNDIHGCEEELRSFVTANHLQGNVTFTGAVRHVQPLLQAADVFVLPTENEAFPVSLLEAMASGLACVASAVGGIPDILDNGTNGLMIPAGNDGALSHALLNLLTGRERIHRLGCVARETIVDRFSLRSVTDSYVTLIDGLTREARAVRARPVGLSASHPRPS